MLIILEDLNRIAHGSDAVLLKFLQQDWNGHQGFLAIVTNPPISDAVCINFVSDIELPVCISERCRIDSTTLMQGTSQRSVVRLVGPQGAFVYRNGCAHAVMLLPVF